MARSIIHELRRRNVFRVTIVYIVISWLLMQVGDVMFPALRLPDWTPTLLVAFLLLGFPLVVVFAWAFELTPDGVVRTANVPEGQSITVDTGRKINYLIIAILAIAVVFLLARDLLIPGGTEGTPIEVTDRSIAVLPFKNQSESSENAEFFAGGLHDELLTLLSKLGDLKVISRTSVERLDPGLTIPEIGQLLGVATVVEGQVQRAGDRLRINVQLIDTAEEGHLWANTYDSELTAENIFDVQSDIARTIAVALQAELSASDVAALQAVPTTDSKALEKYLLAMHIAKSRTFEALREAEAHLLEATRIDPSFVDAWTGLALLRGEMFATGAVSLKQYVDEAGLAVSKALELSPRNAAAIAEQARIFAAENRDERAEEAFRTALELAPQNSNVHENYGEWLRQRGRLEDARDVLRAGLEFDPLSPLLLFQLGRVEMMLGNPERNVEIGERLVDIAPSTVYGYVALLQGRLWQGQMDKAWQWYVKTIETDVEDYETWAHAAVFMEDVGFQEYADRYLAKAESLSTDAPVVIKCKVIILWNRGQRAEAATLARRALETGIDDRWGSDRVLLRTVRDDAFDKGDLDTALALYRDRTPSLFAEEPVITAANANQTADLGLLLQATGDDSRAERLLDAALQWYDRTQPAGVYGYVLGTLKAELLAVAGDDTGAMTTLQEAIESGFRWQWRWSLSSRNFDGIRDLPAFRELLARIESDMAAQRRNLENVPDLGEFDLRDAPAR